MYISSNFSIDIQSSYTFLSWVVIFVDPYLLFTSLKFSYDNKYEVPKSAINEFQLERFFTELSMSTDQIKSLNINNLVDNINLDNINLYYIDNYSYFKLEEIFNYDQIEIAKKIIFSELINIDNRLDILKNKIKEENDLVIEEGSGAW